MQVDKTTDYSGLEKLLYVSTAMLLLAAVWIHLTGPVKDPDSFWHLATGRWIVEEGRLPETDPFTFSQAATNPSPEDAWRVRFILRSYWLAQSLFYLVHQTFGYGGLVAMRAAVLTLVAAAMILWMYACRVPALLAFPLVMAAAHYLSQTPFKNVRPQMFSFLFAVVVLYLLEEALRTWESRDGTGANDETSRWRWYVVLLPITMATWSNLHGGVILGIVIVAIYLGAEPLVRLYGRRKGHQQHSADYLRFASVCVVSGLSSLLNPETYRSLQYVLNLGTASRYGEVLSEYMSPIRITVQFHEPLPAFWGCLALGLFVHVWRFRKIPLRWHLLFLFLGAIALKNYRYSIFFVLIEPLLIAAALADPVRKLLRRLGTLRWGLITQYVALTLLIVSLIAVDVRSGRVLKFGRSVVPNYPTGAVRFIRQQGIRGNVFNTYDWGGFLTWELSPEVRVFYDGRGLVEGDFFAAERVWSADRTDRNGRFEWQALLDDWEADLVLMRGADLFVTGIHPLLPALIVDPDWGLIYRGLDSVLFARRLAHPLLVGRHEIPGGLAFDQVLAQARLALELRPFTPGPWVVMGQALLHTGRRQDALKCFTRALELDPDDDRLRRKVETLGNEIS